MAYYRDLKAGQRVLLWYRDDHVWHDNLVGLLIGGEEVVLYTPDDDLYIEQIGCKGVNGLIKLRGLGPRLGYPRGLHGRIYQFRQGVDNGLIRRVIRESISLIEQERGEAPIPSTVIDASGNEVTLDELFGGRFVQRRLGLGHGARTAVEAPLVERPVQGPRNAVELAPAPQDFVWLAAEPLGGLQLGQEVSLSPESAVGAGDRNALVLRQGHWVKVELVKVEDAGGYADKRRALFSVGVAPAKGESLLDRLRPDSKEQKTAETPGDEIRTLWVDYDDQGERYKRWRDVVNESHTPALDQKPLEGP